MVPFLTGFDDIPRNPRMVLVVSTRSPIKSLEKPEIKAEHLLSTPMRKESGLIGVVRSHLLVACIAIAGATSKVVKGSRRGEGCLSLPRRQRGRRGILMPSECAMTLSRMASMVAVIVKYIV